MTACKFCRKILCRWQNTGKPVVDVKEISETIFAFTLILNQLPFQFLLIASIPNSFQQAVNHQNAPKLTRIYCIYSKAKCTPRATTLCQSMTKLSSPLWLEVMLCSNKVIVLEALRFD